MKLYLNVYQRRQYIGGPWGWAYQVIDENDTTIGEGWRRFEDTARYAGEKAILEIKEKSSKEKR